jgi:uncharacterized protein involved in exopolysaccharide biosynthesis
MADFSQSSLSPMEYLKIFFRRKWFVIIPTFAGLVVGICAGLLLPPKYKSSTIILVQESKTDNPLFEQLAVSSSVIERMQTIRESMLGWNSLVQLVKRLKLDEGIKSAARFEQLILGIRSNIIIRMRGPNVIDLSYVGDEPKMTQAVVKNITDIFVERNLKLQTGETEEAIVFIEEQLKVYRGKIKSAEIVQLQDQLDALLVDSTENHPMVKQFRDQIDRKKEELAAENLEYTEDAMLKSESTNPIISEIKNALEGIESAAGSAPSRDKASVEKDVFKVMLIDRLDNVMARDVKVNEQIYNVLLQRLETAKITQRLQSSKEGTKYTILDPPRVPYEPFQPNKPLVAMIGLIAGLLLGAGLVVMVEVLDKSFMDVQDAKAYFGIPLLGAISKISTAETIHEEQVRQRWYLFLTMVSGAAVVVLTLILKTFIK